MHASSDLPRAAAGTARRRARIDRVDRVLIRPSRGPRLDKRDEKCFCKQVCARPREATGVTEGLTGAGADAGSGRVALVEAVFRPFWARLAVQY